MEFLPPAEASRGGSHPSLPSRPPFIPPPSPLRARHALSTPQRQRSAASPAAEGSVHLSPQRRSGHCAPEVGRRKTPARPPLPVASPAPRAVLRLRARRPSATDTARRRRCLLYKRQEMTSAPQNGLPTGGKCRSGSEKIVGGRESPTHPSAAERRESACGESRSVPESAEWLRKEPRGVAGCLSEKAGWGREAVVRSLALQ